MGLENPLHILILLVVLLLLFGAKRLPEMGRGLGTGIRGFKDGLTGHNSPDETTAAPAAPVAAEPTLPAAQPPVATVATPEAAAVSAATAEPTPDPVERAA